MLRFFWNIVCLSLLASFVACQQGPIIVPKTEVYQWSLPDGFPMPSVPADNLMTDARVALGKMLFYDPVLSVDSSLSCGNCHLAVAGFAEHRPLSIGVEGRMGFRNSPTLTNVAYHPYFFREGGSPSLELQVLGPIENHVEMGFNAALLAQRMQDHPVYESLAQAAYGREMSLFVLTRAIAAFERTLISGDSPYDRYIRGKDEQALTDAQKRGMILFFSERTDCNQCHSGFDFSSYTFENNGLYETFKDMGRYRVSLDSSDIGKFKVLTLRNVSLSWPYMHDGSLRSLEDVVKHYNEGGKGHVNQSPLIRPLGLTEEESADLVAFLYALTDSSFVKNPAFVP